MKYNAVKLASHPRSGSHWIMRLIDLNFFDGSDYLRHYGGHPFGNEPRSLNYFKPNQAVIYTWRNRPDTIKSIYNMRHRFGLDEDDFEKFQTRTMSSMYNPNMKVATVRDTMKEVANINVVDGLLKSRPETVDEFIGKHFLSWFDHKGKDGFLMVQYDEMTSDFDGTMLKIAKFLGSDKTEFIDENKRIGWRAKSDSAWTKP